MLGEVKATLVKKVWHFIIYNGCILKLLNYFAFTNWRISARLPLNFIATLEEWDWHGKSNSRNRYVVLFPYFSFYVGVGGEGSYLLDLLGIQTPRFWKVLTITKTIIMNGKQEMVCKGYEKTINLWWPLKLKSIQMLHDNFAHENLLCLGNMFCENVSP